MYTFDPPMGGALGDPVDVTDNVPYPANGFAFTPNNKLDLLAVGDYAEINTYPSGHNVEVITLPSDAYATGAAINPTEQY